MLYNSLRDNKRVLSENSSSVNSPSREGKKLKIFSFIDKISIRPMPVSQIEKEKKSVKEQLDQYLELIEKDDEVFGIRDFWLKHESEWPDLAAFAKYVFTVPATSAASERVFSVAGRILTPLRQRLGDKLFEMLVFLKCNMKLFAKKNKI